MFNRSWKLVASILKSLTMLGFHKIKFLGCILFLLKVHKAEARYFSTTCNTFNVKSDISDRDESYEDDYGNNLCCQPSYPTLYSYALCNLVTLRPGQKLHFNKDAHNLKYIVFANSNVHLIPVGVFPELETVSQLYLNDSNVNIIHPGAFNGLSKLTELYLQNNNITQLIRGIFNSLSNLMILNISNNSLTTIEENALLGLQNLTRMDLSNNKLKNLSANLFNGLISLNLLDLSHNYISVISSNLFFNLSVRDIYDFPNNLLNHHSPEASLHLDLSYNNLIILNCSDLPVSLQNLYVANNHIEFLKNLEHLSNLQKLDLSNNQINTVANLPLSLNYLNASSNRIENLNNISFHNLQNLTIVDFSFNYISQLHEDNFQDLKYLTHLYLQNNILDNLPIGCFRDLNSLLLLNISSNRITEFVFGTFSGLHNLQNLDISNNTLTDLFENTFHSLASLQTLSIGDNFLTTFNSYDLLRHAKHLSTITLNNNPWNCKSLLKIVTMLKNLKVHILNGSAQKVRNIYGIACFDYSLNNSKELNSYLENTKINQTFQQFSINSKELETLRNFFNGDFLNSSFYNFFKNYNHSLGDHTNHDLKYFDDGFQNSTFFKFFNRDLSNTTFFNSFNKTFFKYFTTIRTTLNETVLTQSFSKYFDDGYKNSSFYKYFMEGFANSGFFKLSNEEKQNKLNSTLVEIISELRLLRNLFTQKFENSTYYQQFEKDYINHNFNKISNFILNNSNTLPSFAKQIDNSYQQINQDILLKISDLKNGMTVLMIIIIIILLCITLLSALKKISNPLNRRVNIPAPTVASTLTESTSGLELM